jgi:hypothetical protein
MPTIPITTSNLVGNRNLTTAGASYAHLGKRRHSGYAATHRSECRAAGPAPRLLTAGPVRPAAPSWAGSRCPGFSDGTRRSGRVPSPRLATRRERRSCPAALPQASWVCARMTSGRQTPGSVREQESQAALLLLVQSGHLGGLGEDDRFRPEATLCPRPRRVQLAWGRSSLHQSRPRGGQASPITGSGDRLRWSREGQIRAVESGFRFLTGRDPCGPCYGRSIRTTTE